MGRQYEQVIPIKTVTILPDGVQLITLNYGKQGTSTVRLVPPPPEKDTERERQVGHDRVQGIMNDVSIHIRQSIAEKRRIT